MPKLKTGEIITWKESLIRFKKGLDEITPLQKLQNELRGTFISLVGYIFCFFAIIYMRDTIGLLAYGLILIFLGSSITTGLRWLALKQQLNFIKNIDSDIDLDNLLNDEEIKNE